MDVWRRANITHKGLQEVQGRARRAEALAEDLMRAGKGLRRFLGHSGECLMDWVEVGGCTCGLEKAISEWEKLEVKDEQT